MLRMRAAHHGGGVPETPVRETERLLSICRIRRLIIEL